MVRKAKTLYRNKVFPFTITDLYNAVSSEFSTKGAVAETREQITFPEYSTILKIRGGGFIDDRQCLTIITPRDKVQGIEEKVELLLAEKGVLGYEDTSINFTKKYWCPEKKTWGSPALTIDRDKIQAARDRYLNRTPAEEPTEEFNNLPMIETIIESNSQSDESATV